MPNRYRKRPVVIEAMQMPDRYPEGVDASSDNYARNLAGAELFDWVEQNTAGQFEPLDVIEGKAQPPASGVSIDPRDGRFIIATLEGLHWVDPGDWVIRGVAGEFYPCKPDIFAATYDPQPETIADLGYEASRTAGWPVNRDDLTAAIETAIINHTAANYPDEKVIGTLRGIIAVEIVFEDGTETLEIIRLGEPYVWQEAGILAAVTNANRQMLNRLYVTGHDDGETTDA